MMTMYTRRWNDKRSIGNGRRKQRPLLRRQPGNSLHCRLGMTLIEVLAGLAILATLLTLILLGFGKHQRQLQLAQRKLAAVAVADRLLTQWFERRETFPVPATGRTTGDGEPFRWQTEFRPSASAAQLGLRLVRVTIQDAHKVSPSSSRQVLAQVELLLPNQRTADTAPESLPRQSSRDTSPHFRS